MEKSTKVTNVIIRCIIICLSVVVPNKRFNLSKAWFKRRILHALNRIAKLNVCKRRRLNQLNATYFNSMRVSRIFD